MLLHKILKSTASASPSGSWEYLLVEADWTGNINYGNFPHLNIADDQLSIVSYTDLADGNAPLLLSVSNDFGDTWSNISFTYDTPADYGHWYQASSAVSEDIIYGTCFYYHTSWLVPANRKHLFFKTINAGSSFTWTEIPPGTDVSLYGSEMGISAVDANNVFVFACAANGSSQPYLKFCKSTDAGSNWTTASWGSWPAASPKQLDQIDCHALDTNHVAAVFQRLADVTFTYPYTLTCAYTSDGGANVFSSTVEAGAVGNSKGFAPIVRWVDSSTIYVTYQNQDGKQQFAKSTNGGASWTLITIVVGEGSVDWSGNTSSMYVVDVNNIYVSAYDENTGLVTIYSSSDTGTTWSTLYTQSIDTGIFPFYNSVVVDSGDNIYVAICDLSAYGALWGEGENWAQALTMIRYY